MTFESFVRYGSLWTLILGLLSLGFAVRNYRRQVNAQIFFEIAGRYHNMLQSFPLGGWLARHNTEENLPDPSTEISAGIFRYLAIVHFAFLLHELRYLSHDLWSILRAEHHRTITTPLFVREWRHVRDEFILFPTFVTYVDSLQSRSTRHAAGQQKRPLRARLW